MLWQPMADKGEPRAIALTSDAVGDRRRRRGPRRADGGGELSALRSHGRPFPGLFIDPHASFSAVWWPAWGAETPPLRFPDRLVAIDGEPVPAPRTRFELPAQAIADARWRRCARAGAPTVRLTFETRDGPIDGRAPAARRAAPTRRCSSSASTRWSALFVLWSGLAVLVLARRRAGAVAYAAWSVGTFVFMVTFYDYHSAAWLAPLFSLSTVSVPVCVVWLAYSFPEPPRARRRALRGGGHRVHRRRRRSPRVVLAIGPYLRPRPARAARRRQRRSRSRACWC